MVDTQPIPPPPPPPDETTVKQAALDKWLGTNGEKSWEFVVAVIGLCSLYCCWHLSLSDLFFVVSTS